MLARAKRFFNPQDAGRLPGRLFWAAFLVRVLYLTLAHTYRIRPADDHFQFGWEMGRIARALATGRGYADPFTGHTGPTAWTPPLYPLLLAGVFRVFGVYTAASAWVILTFNSVFSAATAPAVYRIALRAFPQPSRAGEPGPHRIALWSGWLWALYPAAMQYAVRWVWEMSLTTCLFAWVLLLALRLRDSARGSAERKTDDGQRTTWWLVFGLLWALIALSNSSLLLFLPACELWILWPTLRARRFAAVLRDAALAGAVFLAVLSPWVARNWIAFHAFVPMRSNFGAEIFESARFSNYGFPQMATLPLAESSLQLQSYRRLGEVRYSQTLGARAAALIRANPGLFLTNSLRRVYFFWVSVPHPSADSPRLALRTNLLEAARVLDYAFVSFAGLLGLALALHRRIPAAWLFLWAFVLLPLVYYFVTVQARFRHPLEPGLCVLTVYLFQSADRGRAWSVLGFRAKT